MSETTPPPANPYQSVQPMSPSDEKLWATLIHIGGILFGFLPALIGYIILRDRGPFIRAHSATALNFQLTMLLAYAVGVVTLVIIIGLFVLLAVWVAVIVFGIVAALAANRGQAYTYPLSIRFVS